MSIGSCTQCSVYVSHDFLSGLFRLHEQVADTEIPTWELLTGHVRVEGQVVATVELPLSMANRIHMQIATLKVSF